MKKFMIFLVLLISGFVSTAQSTFTEAIFKEMSNEYKRDSKAFFINRLSEDFRYSNPQGKFLYKSDVAKGGTQQIVSTSAAQKILITLQAIERMLENMLANDVLEPVIFQSSDLAVVSGIQKTNGLEMAEMKLPEKLCVPIPFKKEKASGCF
jgi:hypothetical protein